jgi:type IV pilus assembly protein PilX
MKNHTFRQRQSGVVLFVALMLLLILSMIGVTVARMQTVEERMARNENSRQLASQAAEAGLRNAETYLLNPPVLGAFAGDTLGLYVISGSTGSPLPTATLSTYMSTLANVLTYNGPALTLVPANVGTPHIAIEVVGNGAVPGDPLPNPPPVYRITVQATDADGKPSTVLQEIYR